MQYCGLVQTRKHTKEKMHTISYKKKLLLKFNLLIYLYDKVIQTI